MDRHIRVGTAEGGEAIVHMHRSSTDAPAEATVWAQEVRAVLERMSPLQYQVIVLTYFSGHSRRDAARLLDVSLSTVDQHLADGLLHLGRVMSSPTGNATATPTD